MASQHTIGQIQMVDLKNQYLKNKSAVDQAIQVCLDETSFIKGPQVALFERQLATYLNVPHVISCANGTDALQLAMMALDLKPNDEVIVPAFTYVATAEVIALLGLKPIIIDVDPKTFTINKELVAEAITPQTRLVVPVHLFGQCADMGGILDLCQANEIAIVEDAAQAIGASYTFPNGYVLAAGCLGDLGTTSFFPSKNLGCFGDGGAVFTRTEELACKVRMIANHGQARKYEHEVVGINSRLDSLQAAILLIKLKSLATYTANRQRAAAWYDNLLNGISEVEIPYRAPNSTHVFHQYTIKVPAKKRDGLIEFLKQNGIPSMVYYPKSLTRQKAYQDVGRVVGDLSVTHELCQRVLSLPMHTELTEPQIAYIAETITTYFA
ncbi:DegT/DnrJ/EryC1/StrS family aminotransferase [Spirosoma fluviale]|uniref:dTDP-4-amino-4,6-dideoxygalactose transaminase n=1 Tax=Spirosoma fluviale TaxID=1597977 RepID=A0A286FD49_9BACT|nr:DegT/DnrJ/EryC1/StrS family aminotransferase [Spirosoma fluviale]SOD81177.1 dTDP-4-amino-4,6-dideoxygalactose transaminase [Spirosoma fluviale]